VGEAFARARDVFEDAELWLDGPQASGLEHGELESQIEARGRELMRLMMQGHLDLRAAREPRLERVTGPDQIERTRAEKGHSRPLATIFGPVAVTRIAYRAAGAGNAHPADAALNLPREKHSHGLRRMAASAAARGSFGQACAEVTGRTGSGLHRRQCEELARRAAADFAGFYASRARDPAPGHVLALSCDGKGVVVLPSQMRPEQARKTRGARPPRQDGRLSRGETRDRKRMAEVCAVYDVAPVPRTAEGILGPRPAGAPGPDAPRAAGKWLTAGLAGSAAEVVATAFAEADRRDPARGRTWIALADGNTHQIARIHAEAAARGIAVAVIVDFIHVIERLWTAAWCFLPEADPGAAPWVRAHARAVLDGRAGDAAAAIRAQAAGAGALSKAKERQAAATAAYLDAKAPYLDYPTALASGWPIGTGVIEGACRHLVKDRMDITGARWTVATAEAVLQLRALHANGDFDEYWAYHLQQEHQRNYPQTHDRAA
jgi:hypothetical protein